MTKPDACTLLVPMVRGGQRLLLPATVALTVFYTLGTGPMGIALPAQVRLFDVLTITWLLAITVLVWTREISARWCHLVLSADVRSIDAGNALSLAPGRYVRISCTDTGVGMDAATRLRVFEPFFTTKPLGRGTGLGLSAVWGIAQAHHGAVDVESEPGKGATFSIYLPTTDAAVAAHTAPAPAPAPQRSRRMLIVDDEPMVRAGTARILNKIGFDVTAACNGAEALRLFAEHDGAFDLVVLDMRMPVMDGPECFAELRKTSHVPVLVATGHAVDTDAQALVAAGAGLIEKPFRAGDLAREVTRMLPA